MGLLVTIGGIGTLLSSQDTVTHSIIVAFAGID